MSIRHLSVGLLKPLLAITVLGLCLGLAEIILRWTWSTEKVTLVHDALLGFRGRSEAETIWHREMFGQPRTVRLNEGGYHDHPRRHTPAADTRRLVFLGDSFLEAYQVEIDSNFSQRLGRRLDRHRPASVEAVNLGVHGYGLGVYALQVQERLATWHPDVVVLCLFLGNDLHDNFTPIASPVVPRFAAQAGRLEALPVPPRDLRIWLRDEVLARSSLGRFVWLRVIKSSGVAMSMARAAGMVSTPDLARDAAGQHDNMLKTGQHLLSQIIGDLQEQGAALHVFVIPDPFLVHDLAQQARGQGQVAADDPRRRTEETVLALLRDHDVGFTSPREIFVDANLAQRGVYRRGFGHFTDAAHPLVADLLEAPLRQLLDEQDLSGPLD